MQYPHARVHQHVETQFRAVVEKIAAIDHELATCFRVRSKEQMHKLRRARRELVGRATYLASVIADVTHVVE